MRHIKYTFLSAFLVILILNCTNTGNYNTDIKVLFKPSSNDWIKSGDAVWTFDGDVLIGQLADSGGGFVMTRETYTNVEINLEFYPDSTINSGVFLRCQENALSAVDCYEINIWDLHPNQDYRTGAVVMRTIPMERVQTIGKWNTYRIRIIEDHVQVWINDIKTADMYDDSLIKGFIGLQAAGEGKIMFRNINVRNI